MILKSGDVRHLMTRNGKVQHFSPPNPKTDCALLLGVVKLDVAAGVANNE